MDKYKIEFKQIFTKEITVFADSEKEALDIIEETYFKTDLLDKSERDLSVIEVKVMEKNNQKVEKNETENTMEYLEDLADEMEEMIDEMKEVISQNK